MNNKTVNIVFSGLGGQGVLTMSDICSKVAMEEGFDVKRTDLHGLSQRGGVVESHLRIGSNIFSPLIMNGQANYNVSLNEKLSRKFKANYLHKSGFDFTFVLKMAEKKNIPFRERNLFMLGVLSTKLSFSEKCWKSVIVDKMENKKTDFWGTFVEGASYKEFSL